VCVCVFLVDVRFQFETRPHILKFYVQFSQIIFGFLLFSDLLFIV